MRSNISEMPMSHLEMGDSFHGVTELGSEVDVRVSYSPRELTSNERAVQMMQQRTRAAAEARMRGVPLGRDLGVRFSDDKAGVSISVSVSTVSGFDCSYHVHCDSLGNYVADGSRSPSLCSLVDRLASRVERQAGVTAAAAAAESAQPRF